MIGIVDYRLGNTRAFANIYKELDRPFIIASNAKDLQKASRIILPGVGAFDQAMKRLNDSGMRDCLDEMVLHKKRPVLGVCVGMQILGRRSEEGTSPGLGWIEAEVVRFKQPAADPTIQIPHMGWNGVTPVQNHGLFKDLDETALFYFLHSYFTRCKSEDDVIAGARHGSEFTCAIGHANIYGVQFHPEKSHRSGIKLLRNFLDL